MYRYRRVQWTKGKKIRAQKETGREHSIEGLFMTFCEIWFLDFRLDRFEDSLYLKKATQLSIISSMKLIPTTS